MRRRLVLLSLATTVLVVVAFVVPLGLLVRRQAVEAAKVGAERNAQSVAAVVALAVAVSDDPAVIAATIGELSAGTIVVLDGTTIGEPRQGQGTLVESASIDRRTIANDVAGGWEIALPVVVDSGVAVVDSYVNTAELTAGVATAWLLLAALALVLIGVAVWVADRLGRRMTAPIEDLAHSSRELAEGNLDVRVEPTDPDEIRAMGEAFNYLAGRLHHLLAEERESAANLSHRLRTPLTSLRLQAEALKDSSEREKMIGQVDRLERAMNQVIELARSRAAQAPAKADINRVLTERASFWRVLAEEQDRDMVLNLSHEDGVVPLSEDELGAVVDTLIGNVFAHTAAQTGFVITTGHISGVPYLEVTDSGPGFSGDLIERGVSGGGSTGLGLDIVGKTARSVGGSLEISDRPGGGAVVKVIFG